MSRSGRRSPRREPEPCIRVGMTLTRRPCSAAVAAVTGPIAATTTPSGAGPASPGSTRATNPRTVDELVNVTASICRASRSARARSDPSRVERRPVGGGDRDAGAGRRQLSRQHVPRLGGAHQQRGVAGGEPGAEGVDQPLGRELLGYDVRREPFPTKRLGGRRPDGDHDLVVEASEGRSARHGGGARRNAATPFTLVKIRQRKPSRERIASSSGVQSSGGSMRIVGSVTVSAP